MPQVTATPSNIYDVLANDSTFTSYLGEYNFKSGNTYPSLSILTPGQNLPSLKNQTGLECIIHDSGDVNRSDFLNDDASFVTTWKVFLIVWDPATGSTLDSATKRIMHLFNGATSIETVAVSKGTTARVQTMILIPESQGLHQDAMDILDTL